MGQNDIKTSPKWCQHDAKMIPKWPQNNPKSTPNMSKIIPNDPILVPKWSKKVPETTRKTAPKDAKMVKNGPETRLACSGVWNMPRQLFFLNIDIVNKSEGFFSRLLKAGHLPCVPCELSPPEKCPGVSITRKMQIVIVFSLSQDHPPPAQIDLLYFWMGHKKTTRDEATQPKSEGIRSNGLK